MAGEDKDEDEDVVLSREDVKAMLAEQRKEILQTMKAGMSGITSELKEALDGLKPKEPEPKPDDPPEPKEGDSKEVVAMRAELEKMRSIREREQARLAEREKELEAEKAARAQEGLRNAAIAALGEAGVSPAMQKVALNHLMAEGAVKLNDDGKPVFVFDRNGYPEEVADLTKAAKEYVGTETGKAFLPAVEGGGTGDHLQKPSPTPRTQSGGVDWGALGDRPLNLNVLRGLGD